ncbi:hypothetical protein KSP39_PZI000366 [Platanthera zijinensis]|uniref:Retrotransposon gag domain-containing protein n=1 Tax=Platanthera zijinensis TaxID=2320716 RepID=A0AAP0C409_9ASPA
MGLVQGVSSITATDIFRVTFFECPYNDEIYSGLVPQKILVSRTCSVQFHTYSASHVRKSRLPAIEKRERAGRKIELEVVGLRLNKRPPLLPASEEILKLRSGGGLVLHGHHNEVWLLAVCHEGKYLASSSNDSSVIIWEAQLRKRYVPHDYLQTLYRRFHNLRQEKATVDEYTDEFLVLQSRLDLREDDDMTVSHYLNGLHYSIQDQLELHDYCDLGEVFSRARRVESLLKRTSGARSTDRSTTCVTTTTTARISDSPHPPITAGNKDPSTSHSKGKEIIGTKPNTGVFRRFKCMEPGYKSSESPRRHFVAIIDSTDGREPEYGVYVNETHPELENEHETEEVIEVEGEQAEHLVCVLKYSLITPSESTEDEYRRHDIFRTTARIKGQFCSIIINSGSMENCVPAHGRHIRA